MLFLGMIRTFVTVNYDTIAVDFVLILMRQRETFSAVAPFPRRISRVFIHISITIMHDVLRCRPKGRVCLRLRFDVFLTVFINKLKLPL